MGLEYQVLCQRIEDAYAGLTPQLKQAARHALDHPDDIALLSMRQFAAKADVHPSSMVRLVKELGLSGYTAFQEPFRARLRTRPEEHYSRNARSIQARAGQSSDAMLDEMFEMEHANLKSIVENVGYDALMKCARMMSKAPRVFVAGARSCYPVAFHFQYACRMFDNKMVLLEGRGGTFADELRGATDGDVLLAISFAPYSRNIVHAVDYATRRKTTVIALTDSTLSPLIRNSAAYPLLVRTSSPSMFHSVVPAMSVAQALILLMMAEGGEKALSELTETESLLSEFEAYWFEGDRRKGGRR